MIDYYSASAWDAVLAVCVPFPNVLSPPADYGSEWASSAYKLLQAIPGFGMP